MVYAIEEMKIAAAGFAARSEEHTSELSHTTVSRMPSSA